MKKINWFRLISSIVICQLAGLIGAIFTTPGVKEWYPTLNKPSFTPPNWLFAPVWTLLFLLMGIALYLIWQKGFKNNKQAIIIFASQLFLNICWSVLFFYAHWPLAAFFEILLLWVFIVLSIAYFYKISKVAAYLLIPYLLWVSLASALNFYLYLLN